MAQYWRANGKSNICRSAPARRLIRAQKSDPSLCPAVELNATSDATVRSVKTKRTHTPSHPLDNRSPLRTGNLCAIKRSRRPECEFKIFRLAQNMLWFKDLKIWSDLDEWRLKWKLTRQVWLLIFNLEFFQWQIQPLASSLCILSEYWENLIKNWA